MGSRKRIQANARKEANKNIVFAKPGAILPGNFKIKKVKIRIFRTMCYANRTVN